MSYAATMALTTADPTASSGWCWRKGAALDAGPAVPLLDFPVTGMLLAAVGAWSPRARRGPEPAVRLLVLARRFSYNRTFPVMAWEPLAEAAEHRQARPARRAPAGVRRPTGPRPGEEVCGPRSFSRGASRSSA